MTYDSNLVTDSAVCVVLICRPSNRSTDILGVYANYLTADKRIRELRECFAIGSNDIVTIHTEAIWRYL